MATCQFCGRQFTNTQAVRAHLKACAVYHGRDQATGSALGRVALGTVPEAADAGTELPNGEVARDGQRAAARLRGQERADRQALREARGVPAPRSSGAARPAAAGADPERQGGCRGVRVVTAPDHLRGGEGGGPPGDRAQALRTLPY